MVLCCFPVFCCRKDKVVCLDLLDRFGVAKFSDDMTVRDIAGDTGSGSGTGIPEACRCSGGLSLEYLVFLRYILKASIEQILVQGHGHGQRQGSHPNHPNQPPIPTPTRAQRHLYLLCSRYTQSTACFLPSTSGIHPLCSFVPKQPRGGSGIDTGIDTEIEVEADDANTNTNTSRGLLPLSRNHPITNGNGTVNGAGNPYVDMLMNIHTSIHIHSNNNNNNNNINK